MKMILILCLIVTSAYASPSPAPSPSVSPPKIHPTPSQVFFNTTTPGKVALYWKPRTPGKSSQFQIERRQHKGPFVVIAHVNGDRYEDHVPCGVFDYRITARHRENEKSLTPYVLSGVVVSICR